jgi:hypothetical protein
MGIVGLLQGGVLWLVAAGSRDSRVRASWYEAADMRLIGR